MNRSNRPRVAVLGTGGSISMIGRNSLDLYEYGTYQPVLEVDELLARVPEVHQVADVVAVRFRAIGSSWIGPAAWLELVEKIHQVAAADSSLAGIVVTHGTATLEETAYFLNLTLKVELPVVVTGAMRPTTGLSADAHLNLLNAIQVAGSPAARGLGVLVVLNQEIQAAREVTKGSNYRLETFRTHELGRLGYADPDGTVAIYRAPTRRHAPDTIFDISGRTDLPAVEIVYSYAGVTGTVIRALVEAGAEGIVSAGFPSGFPAPAERQALIEARSKGVLVVQSSRAGAGRVIRNTTFREAGFVVADNLNPQKARILAMLALTITEDPEAVQALFNEY